VRWDGLFADLEAQARELEVAERAGEIDERARMELARVRLVDRLRPAVGLVIRVRCGAGVSVTGTLVRVASQWLLVDEAAGRQALVAMGAVAGLSGLSRQAAAADGDRAALVIESRLGLAHALRGIARDRSPVAVELTDGSSVAGTIDRVGADFVEVAVHPMGEPRRRNEVRDVLLVALSALAVVRRDG
jgi:hypothetical protein